MVVVVMVALVEMHFIPVAPNEERDRESKGGGEDEVWTSTDRPTLVTLPQHGLSHPPAQTTYSYYFATIVMSFLESLRLESHQL